jgi:hypothetical protein
MSVFTCATFDPYYHPTSDSGLRTEFCRLLSNAESINDGPVPRIIDATEIIQ